MRSRIASGPCGIGSRTWSGTRCLASGGTALGVSDLLDYGPAWLVPGVDGDAIRDQWQWKGPRWEASLSALAVPAGSPPPTDAPTTTTTTVPDTTTTTTTTVAPTWPNGTTAADESIATGLPCTLR